MKSVPHVLQRQALHPLSIRLPHTARRVARRVPPIVSSLATATIQSSSDTPVSAAMKYGHSSLLIRRFPVEIFLLNMHCVKIFTYKYLICTCMQLALPWHLLSVKHFMFAVCELLLVALVIYTCIGMHQFQTISMFCVRAYRLQGVQFSWLKT